MSRFSRLSADEGSARYVDNTTILLAERVLRMGIGFFVIIAITRYLGPERFGSLAYAQSLVGVFTAFASLGLDSIVVRELVSDERKRDSILGTAFYLKLLTALIAVSIILLLNGLYLDEDASTPLVGIIALSIVFNSLNVIDMYFQSKVLSRYVVYANSIAFALVSAFKLLLIYFEADLVYFAYALLLETVSMALGYLYIYRSQRLAIRSWRFDREIAYGFLRSAWPLVLVAVSAFLYTRIDQVMIKEMLDAEAVGQYAAAVKVSELLYFIPAIIVSSYFPKIVEARRSDTQEYLGVLEGLYRLVVWIAIPIAISMSLLSEVIIGLLYGEQYQDAHEVLSILAWAIILVSVGSVFVKMLYVEHLETRYLYKSLVGVVMNVLLNLFLIPMYGIVGAAIATLMTLLSINYLYDLFDSRLRGYYYLKLRCFLPSITKSHKVR